MIKFEKKYLYCFADVEEAKKLIGVKGLFFDDILDVSDLETLMLEELISLSGDEYTVALCFGTSTGNFRYFYYDPNLEVKRAYYLEGKQIQWRDEEFDWCDCFGTPCWNEDTEYRIKPEETRLTRRELSKWLIKGNGEALFGETIVTSFNYIQEYQDLPFYNDNVKIRKWSDSEWHEATREYIEGKE